MTRHQASFFFARDQWKPEPLVLVLFHFRYQYLYWLLLGSATNRLDDALALEIKPRVRLVQLFLDGRVLGHLGAVIHEVTSERE